jgi:hypothetical protein
VSLGLFHLSRASGSYKESFVLKSYSFIGYIPDKKKKDFIQIFFISVDIVANPKSFHP